MTEPESAKPTSPDSLMLFGFWYRVLPSDRVPRGELVKARLLEIPMVIGRDKRGRAFALRDACPHRGMPLSCGWFDGQQVECSYHGWKFDAHSGQCQLIPSLTSDQSLRIDRIYAGSFACEEHDEYIWAFVPEPAVAGAGFTQRGDPTEAVPRVPSFNENYKLAYLTADMPVSVDHGIIGLMDPAHGPFVHQAWWWRSRQSIHEKQKAFEPIPYGFRMSAHTPSSNSAPYKLLQLYAKAEAITTTIDFILPNRRLETIRAGKYWFSSLTTVTPIDRNHCRIDVVAGWNIFQWLPYGAGLLRYVFGKFVEQDRRTMEMQAEGLKHNPHMMLIEDADRPAKWYFHLKQAYLQSRRTGEAFRHPLAGPVTLKWRS